MTKPMIWVMPKDVQAITLAPFGIYFRSDKHMSNSITVTHETIHWHQQLEMGIIFFYLWYIIEYGIKWLRHKKEEAYYTISFEREAYQYQAIPWHLKDRKHYFWFRLI